MSHNPKLFLQIGSFSAHFTGGVRVKWLGDPVAAEKKPLSDDPLEDEPRTDSV